ncbi:MAG: AMP-binding protein [Tepidisphaeraceae bacterium]
MASGRPNAKVIAVYGSTEAEPIAHVEWTTMSPADKNAQRQCKGLLAGTPVRHVQVAILPNTFGTAIAPMSDAEFNARKLVGQPGEIAVTGDHVLKGYLDGVGDVETKFRVGAAVWHRTGDAGYVDSQGRVWLLGRASAVVRDAFGELYPLQAEAVAYECPHVRRCALVTHQNRRALVVETSAPPAVVRDDLLRRLSPLRIDQLLFVDRIPVDRRHRSKIDYGELKRVLDRL